VSLLVVSYHPLLRAPIGALVELPGEEAASALQEMVDSLPDGAAEACLWASEDGAPQAVLLFDRGREIAEHLAEWSEGDPRSWFKLHVAEEGGIYCMFLMPDVAKSCDRQMAGRALATGRAVPAHGDRSVLFKPLRFVSNGPSETFSRLRKSIRERMSVYILDRADVPPDGPMGADQDKLILLGSFDVVWDDSPYVMSMIREQSEE
jgi:hypothetical protein